jgi:alkylation response protein AidB-like acyl-CoA dehydrogenase/flavin-dependent dehydrogenase/ferredoxin-like protein FixX
MASANFDIVIVGAGAAGLTAAIGLARANFRVAVVEAAAFPGAENWSGCVYFAENLAHPDILGPDGVEALAWERRLVERGFFATDGHGLLGMKYRDPDAFRHCYTVLRPIYDHHLAQVALRHGVALLTSTTAESLIREDGRIIGICTQRGPIYASCTFLAEGDASHLVSLEGYERLPNPKQQPKFLQGIKQVIELPPRAIEQRFGVGEEQGAAYEMLLRNGTLRGQAVHLNMGGFLYTNRQSLSIGLVLPADNLHQHFDGDPNLLMEWFLNLPSLKAWLEGAKQGPFGAKLIRGGGIKEVPTLIDDGLAIGGAASGIGIDFPYPNFTGPATAMGLLLTHAAQRIRQEGGTFTKDELDRHYLQPLRKTHYWQDVEFLRHWPAYVKKTSVFFGKNIDVALGSAYLWTRPGKGLGSRWNDWLHLVQDMTGGEQRKELEGDVRDLTEALHVHEVAPRPSVWRLLLDGTLNTFRDVLREPRTLPAHGEIALHYSVAGGAEPGGLPPASLRRWFERYAPAVAAAASVVYRNDATPLAKKLPTATRLLTGHVSLMDLIRALGLGLVAALQWLRPARNGKPETEEYFRTAQAATDLTSATANATAAWEARLAQLSYETVKESHIHVLWPESLPEKNAVVKAGLWHVCPAHVYEARVGAAGQVQVVVNYENCIKCETCWRTSDIVDWGRDGLHRFVYAVHSPVVGKLLAEMDRAGNGGKSVVRSGPASPRVATRGPVPADVEKVLFQLHRKLEEFDAALAEEPRTIDRDRAAHLEMLVRYALSCSRDPERRAGERGGDSTRSPALRSGSRLHGLIQRMLDHLAARHYAWAAADGRQLRMHDLAGLVAPAGDQQDSSWHSRYATWPLAESYLLAADVKQRLDEAFPPAVWRDLEQRLPFTEQQNKALWSTLPAMQRFDERIAWTAADPTNVLVDLARRDPSLAYRFENHLWAQRFRGEHSDGPADGGWWAFAKVDERGEALLVPACDAERLVIQDGDRVQVFSAHAPGVTVEPLATLGLRGAGLARVRISREAKAEGETPEVTRKWAERREQFSALHLAAIAYGMADYLCKRSVDHATGRVQFPSLFHDEQAHDTIGKFGAVKKMIAEMAAGRQLIEAVAHCLSPVDWFQLTPTRAGLLKAVVAEVLGTAPGSIAYNAGQVFGGTGYSEDDTLSKLYRDAAACRFLGVPNSEIYARHGRDLLERWTPDGQLLSRCPDEDTLFEEIVQRQALTGELHQIRQHATKLIERVNAWKFAEDAVPTAAAVQAVQEAVARQDAFLLASKALVLRTHARLEIGDATETDVALLRVWFNMLRGWCDDFDAIMRYANQEDPTPLSGDGPPVTQYADFLKTDLPYNSGDFLSRPTDPLQPRYVPEMNQTDEFLSKRNKELIDLITAQFGAPRNGMVYERYLEEQHRPDAADLDFLRDHGFFRMPIPRDLGGEGRSKADYYLLTVNTHRLADAAISLTIQVCSSLGTTPVLLGRDKDLPKAIKSTPHGELLRELHYRREAADLFLHWVASGQISAFALTEPSAGSDTARVATRAKLRQVPVEEIEEGIYRFVPAGGKEERILIDARRVEFTKGAKPQPVFRGAPIQFDEYNYETDAVKKRYFVLNGRKVYFDDIAQLRPREGDGKLWYDYYELTGAKMWITNGRVMGTMALYAKTDAGVTGFIVDRHSEGLIVGKDEAKMGQNGSPTNELALQAVRVPRENIIGLEGRGQVNALETLNVGRAGLAMSAMSQMVRLCDWSRAFAKQRYGDIPQWIAWRLERMEEERFIAEAVSYEIIGRFEHKQTKSVRMESAIAKMLVSELFHHSIEIAEEIHGPDGQTQEHLIEKRKRDARVLNIYEGTNEIQRFLILKELTELAGSWQTVPKPTGGNPWASALDTLKERLRQLTTEAVQHFGPQLWQNPNLQANCFQLSEAAAWVAAAESTLGRLTWLSRMGDADPELLATGRRALTRCQAEVENRLTRFAAELVRLRQGRYAPEIRAASLLFDHKKTPAAGAPASTIDRSFSILVVLDPPTPGAPHPHTQDGKLVEPYRVLTEGDRAALETALRLRDAAGATPVNIQVTSAGPAAAATLLRETLSLGIDRVRLVVTDGSAGPDRAAATLGRALHGDAFDLVLGGAGAADAQEGLLARLTAEVLGIPVAGTAAQVAVDTVGRTLRLVGSDGQGHTRSLGSAVMIEPGLALRPFTIDGWLRGLEKQVEPIPWPADLEAAAVDVEETAAAPTTAGERPPQPLLPREASRLVLETAGIEIAAPGRHAPVQTALPLVVDVSSPFFAEKNGPMIVALLAADADGKLRPTARRALDAAQFLTPYFQGASKAALVVVPRGADILERVLAELTTLTPFDVCLLAVDGADASDEVRCRLVAECWSALENFPVAVVGEPWSEAALAHLATASGVVDPIALRVRLLDRHQGRLVAEGSCAKGKLRTRQTLAPAAGQSVWIGLAGEAEVGAASPPERRPTRRVERWSPRLERFYGQADMQRLLQELKQDTGLVRLSDAEFIIDVGFGVGNRDGYEAVIDPLEKALRHLGVKHLMIGGSRKVTEELHLLPNDRQIGQSGVSVNPRVLLAIGVSGAPQHLNYIGPRATIIAFNRDAEAPLMTLNQRQARPRVYPVIGDLFETVPALIACLGEERGEVPVERVEASAVM